VGPITVFTASGVHASSSNGNSSSSSSSDVLKLNSTCAVVRIVPGLDAGAAAVLRLPKGARYSGLAGPVAKDLDIDVSAVERPHCAVLCRAGVGRCWRATPCVCISDSSMPRHAVLCCAVAGCDPAQVFGLRPFRIPLRWDFANVSTTQEPLYSGAK
jgi:hypothetical protein